MTTATRVAGFWTWKNMGRGVKAGQKGIRGVRRKKQEEAEKDITKQNERVFSSPYLVTVRLECTLCGLFLAYGLFGRNKPVVREPCQGDRTDH